MLDEGSSDLEAWDWTPQPRDPAPTLSGQIQAVIETGLVDSSVELARLSAMLTTGFPDRLTLTAHWSVRPEGPAVVVEAGSCRMEQVFELSGSERHVDFKSFTLAKKHRGLRLGATMMRNNLLVYDQLGVKTVRAKTFRDGNFVWARLGACPQEPEQMRQILKERTRHFLEDLDAIALEDAAALYYLTQEPDHAFMHAIACCVAEHNSADEVGVRFLQGLSWNAIWRLHDPLQRRLIKEALGGS